MVQILLTLPALLFALTSGAFAQGTGTSFCNPTNNSTGVSTDLTGSFGSGMGSDLHLEVTGGVPNEFGYFLVGNETTAGVVTSNGLFCLVGTATSACCRYNVVGSSSNSIGVFDANGVLQNLPGTSTTGSGFDVPSTLPTPIPLSIRNGDTWHFQFWHRDTSAAAGSSNFSNGLSVTFGFAPQPIAGMVAIPAGSFNMGTEGALGLPYFVQFIEGPVHHVAISQDFWMGEHEVTQAEYQALMGVNPSQFSGTDHPVESVDLSDAKAYCAALTAQERAAGHVPALMEYRLPTEAEWEYACRAGTTTEFNVGAELSCDQALLNYSYHSASYCGLPTTAAVGSYEPNAFGLYDMHGNVWEWCLDTLAQYPSGAVTDPLVIGAPEQVFRGGAWNYNSDTCRSTSRGANFATLTSSSVGFRVVLAATIQP